MNIEDQREEVLTRWDEGKRLLNSTDRAVGAMYIKILDEIEYDGSNDDEIEEILDQLTQLMDESGVC